MAGHVGQRVQVQVSLGKADYHYTVKEESVQFGPLGEMWGEGVKGGRKLTQPQLILNSGQQSEFILLFACLSLSW